MKVTGVILDIMGIQNYITNSNRLKLIAAGSGIVEHVYSQDFLTQAMKKTSLGPQIALDWRNSQELLITKGDIQAETAYIGGGNALLLFKDPEIAKEFCRSWTLQILEQFPTLQPIAACYTADDFDPENTSQFIINCHAELANAKAQYFRNNDLPRYGVTAECTESGASAGLYHCFEESGSNQYYSSAIAVKYKIYADGLVDKNLAAKLSQSDSQLKFPVEFDTIGGVQTREKNGADSGRSSIAVVHIDGNALGKKFQSIESLKDYRQLSVYVEELFTNAMGKVIDELKDNKDIRENLHIKNNLLPIRPIIFGGDDVTYVCHGQIGLWTVERFLTYLRELQSTGSDLITACAGIVITKPNYPFSRAYEIAEDLCKSAKDAVPNSDKSALDFHILKGGVLNKVEDLRKDVYQTACDSLVGRPLIFDWDTSYRRLKKGAQEIASKWPNSKIKQIREMIFLGEASLNQFLVHCERQGNIIKERPEYSIRLKSGQDKDRDRKPIPTWLDLCEFLDIYPPWLLTDSRDSKNTGGAQ